jgi:hypothetical protein
LAGLIETQLLELQLKNLQNAKITWFQEKTLACADFVRTTNWMVWYRTKSASTKRTARREQGFEFKVS